MDSIERPESEPIICMRFETPGLSLEQRTPPSESVTADIIFLRRISGESVI